MNPTTATPSRPSPVGMISGTLIVFGVALSMFGSMGFLILAGLGAFGPGILRELGWLRDQDEFQRRAAHRAGYVAYLAGGLAAVVAISILRWDAANLEGAAQWVALVLIVLWLTWLFSSLLTYWGALRTARRVLVIFGTFWAAFVIGSHMAEPGTLVLEALLFVLPFYALAWAAGRWPRAVGAALVAVSAVAFGWLFDFGREFVRWPSQILTFTLLLVPSLACGLALLRATPSD